MMLDSYEVVIVNYCQDLGYLALRIYLSSF